MAVKGPAVGQHAEQHAATMAPQTSFLQRNDTESAWMLLAWQRKKQWRSRQ